MIPTIHNTLVMIPARAGSKGVPKKNSKPFAGGASLTERAVILAKSIFPVEKIIVSTDDEELQEISRNEKVLVRERPLELANDHVGMMDVIIDAILYSQSDAEFLLLMQPTSPFREKGHILKAMEIFQSNDEAVVSVCEPSSNPYFTMFKEKNGYIEKFMNTGAVRRQDVETIYDVNGMIYLFNVSALMKAPWTEFTKIRPLVIPKWQSLDIDTEEDWWLAETITKNYPGSSD